MGDDQFFGRDSFVLKLLTHGGNSFLGSGHHAALRTIVGRYLNAADF